MNDNFFCRGCKKAFPMEENALNLAGTNSTSCHQCKDEERERNAQLQQDYKDLKYKAMLEMGSSCQKCNCIFLFEESKLVTLETKESSEGRLVKYKGEKYLTRDFLIEKKNILELDILQCDHMTEEEQRERGILKEGEDFIPKKRMVSQKSSKKAMESEMPKCQVLCAFCHLIVTIDREIGLSYKTPLRKKKLKYIKNLKDKGCVECGYINIDLPRFFHMDHLIPLEKTKGVAEMTMDDNFSFEEVVGECKKCRVLCNFCHTIHSRNQRKDKNKR